jgi:hypothetical protein
MNIRIVAAMLAAALVGTALWQTHAGAAPKKPVALQYDEIVRMAIAPNSPPPPGAFQTDYAAIMSGVPTTSATAAPATPTPAPRRHGLFGQIAQIVTNGIPTGDESGDQGSQGGPGGGYAATAMNAMKRMQEGSLTRLTFYKNWLRTDDPVDRTATISKCDIHQFITLDLARKTYSIANTAPKCPPANAPRYAGPGRTTVESEAPGTGDITFKNSTANLGPKTLDGIPTIGWDRTMEYSATNATGSCTNGDFKVATLAYVSQIVPPRRFCPMPAGVPTNPESVIVHGGCKPRMHNAIAGFGSISDRLEMYLKMTAGSGGQNGGGFATVTERGNVKWYQQSQADALFSVPPGFTKQ